MSSLSSSELGTYLLSSGFSCDCQTSISIDVLCTALACAVYIYYSTKLRSAQLPNDPTNPPPLRAAVLFVLAIPVLSLGGSFAIYLATTHWNRASGSGSMTGKNKMEGQKKKKEQEQGEQEEQEEQEKYIENT